MTLPIESHAASQPKLSHKNLTIYSGVGCGTKTITVKGLSEGTKVTWKSSNKKIATVKNGVVTPKKPGKVTITAQVQGKKLSCKVTVKKAKVYIFNKKNTKYSTAMIDGFYGKHETSWAELNVGTDIPAGQYKVLINVNGYTSVEELDTSTGLWLCGIIYGRFGRDSNGRPFGENNIFSSGAELNTDIIEVKKGNTIVLHNDGVMFIPVRYVNTFRNYSWYMEEPEQYVEDAALKVGRDIPAGEYVVSTSIAMECGGNIIENDSLSADVVISNNFYEGWRMIRALGDEYISLKKSGNAKTISLLGDFYKIKKTGYVSKDTKFYNNYRNFNGYIATLVTLKKGEWIFWGGEVNSVLPAPKEFVLNLENKVLKKGQKFQLKIKDTVPEHAYDDVKYSSSNTKVATVGKNGMVKAKKTGTAVITVQSVIKKKVKATCIITVKSNKKPTKTPTPTKKPTATPTKKPTAVPTKKLTPTLQATKQPSVTPTQQPGETLTATPKVVPTAEPTSTQEPEAVPAQMESVTPTVNPEGEPTLEVTATITTEVEMTPEPGADIDVNAEDIETEE